MALLLTDVSYNGIAVQIRKSESKYKEQNSTNKGGFITPKVEKEFSLAIKYWRTNILNGRNQYLQGLDLITWKLAGNIKKGPREFVDLMIKDAALFKLILNKHKANRNIHEFSFLRLYLMAYEIVTDADKVAVFEKAYKICKETKGKPSGSNVADIFVMAHTVLAHFIASCIGTINTAFYQSINDSDQGITWETYDITGLELLIQELQRDYRATIAIPGFATIDLFYFLGSLKSPMTEFNKAIKLEKDTIKEMKAKEDFSFYNATNDVYLVDRTVEHTMKRGKEDFGLTVLVLAGIIFGIIGLFKLIKLCIYKIAAIKIDIIKYIIYEYEVLRMNMNEINVKIINEKDPKARAKLESIKRKQQAWKDRFEKFIGDDWEKGMYESEAEAIAQADTQDEQIARDEADGKQGDSGDFQTVL